MQSVRQFFHRHPILCETLRWAIPALMLGLIIRLLLLSYSPYAYWGSDSRSYFGFAHGVLTKFYFSLNEKRRYLYPIFLVPVSALPGEPLRWLAWIQALLGLSTTVAFAYAVRRAFYRWQLWIIPLTVIYACMPVLVWYEHELLGESLFFDALIWACAGWIAWVSQPDRERARRLWWMFYIPLAIALLTKPSGRFFWPGILLALVLERAWRVLKVKEMVAMAALFGATLTMGDDNQAAWLMYVSAFPLTQLDTPLHAEYKAEIRPKVEKAWKNIDNYPNEEPEVFTYLRNPKNYPEYPLWQEIGKHEKELTHLYRDLAIEGIKAHPFMLGYISLQRIIGSADPTDFNVERFRATYFADRLSRASERSRNSESMMRLAFAIPKEMPYPEFDYFQQRIAPHPDSKAAVFLQAYAKKFGEVCSFFENPKDRELGFGVARPTFLCWWALAAVVASFFGPYRRTLAVWTVCVICYIFGTYLVGTQNQRYFVLAWPFLLLLLPVIPDGIARIVKRLRDRKRAEEPAPVAAS